MLSELFPLALPPTLTVLVITVPLSIRVRTVFSVGSLVAYLLYGMFVTWLRLETPVHPFWGCRCAKEVADIFCSATDFLGDLGQVPKSLWRRSTVPFGAPKCGFDTSMCCAWPGWGESKCQRWILSSFSMLEGVRPLWRVIQKLHKLKGKLPEAHWQEMHVCRKIEKL